MYFTVAPKFQKLWSQNFAAVHWKKLLNESDVIINGNNLNRSIFRHFALFCCCFQRNHTCVINCIYLFLEPYIVIQYWKNENLFDLRKSIILRDKENIDFNTLFYQYIVTAFRVKSIVRYRYSLLVIDTITSTFNKRWNLHLVSLFCKNFPYYQTCTTAWSIKSHKPIS